MTILIYILCIGYIFIIITNPLESGSSLTTITNSSTTITNTNTTITNTNITNVSNTNVVESDTSTNNTDSSNGVDNGLTFQSYNDTRITTKSLNFDNNSDLFEVGEEGFMFAVKLENNQFNDTMIYIQMIKALGSNGQIAEAEIGFGLCTSDHFPPEALDIVQANSIIGEYYCPNKTQVKLLKNIAYSNYRQTILRLRVWGGTGWDTYSDIKNQYNRDIARVVTVEGYYDPDDYDNPVKYTIGYDYTNYIRVQEFDMIYIKVKRNLVNMMDGSTKVFYNTEFIRSTSTELGNYAFFHRVFSLNHEYTQYDQFVNYQISESRRMLAADNSASDEDIMPSYYFIVYAMSQFGGLYTFLHLLFGCFMNRWTEQSLNQEIANTLLSKFDEKSNQRVLAKSQKLEKSKIKKVSPHSENHALDWSLANNENDPLVYNKSVNLNKETINKQRELPSLGQNQELDIEINQNKNSMNSSESSKEKSVWKSKDICYGVFWCFKCGSSISSETYNGRQNLLKYQIQGLNHEFDIFTILDTLNSIKEQVNSVDCRLSDTLVMIYNRTLEEYNGKQSTSVLEKLILEDEKNQEKDDFKTKIKASPIFDEQTEKKVHKDEVKSINKILNSEIGKLVNHMQPDSSEKEPNSAAPKEGLKNQAVPMNSFHHKNTISKDDAPVKTKDSKKNIKQTGHHNSVVSKDSKPPYKSKVDSLLRSFESMDINKNEYDVFHK